MAKIKPWFQVVTPREDLRENRPLDASEFAVHLDRVRDGTAREDYAEPARFFERTYLTKNLLELAVQAVRRLSGLTVETSAIFNMATQFGGGKTHALTLLYHLARAGDRARGWMGVDAILSKAQIKSIPEAATAIFVGTEFDSLEGRGGKGEPTRKTPWGEIAWQLGGKAAFDRVAKHDQSGQAPGGDVINAILPDGPSLILMDELMNYVSRHRKSGLSSQLYNFLQNLSEAARSRRNVVLAVSIPASELEMNAEDQRDYESFKKMLNRVGKAIIMSAEAEASEIIRRRLFEWYGIPEEAKKTVTEYVTWLADNKSVLGNVDVEAAREQFLACYPFHPALLSVFERKWQSLPRFQKTRGILRLLALWVSRAFNDDHLQARRDPFITLGSAPLEDSMFRAAVLEELGDNELEVPVTTDIAGKKTSHAVRLDRDADEAVKKVRLHQKVATAILFESKGGHLRTEATLPEIRFAVAEPDLDIASIETAVESLSSSCYFLSNDRGKFRFSTSPNLNKVLIDRKASIQPVAVNERVRKEIAKLFDKGPGFLQRIPFPKKTNDVPDQAKLMLVILPPEQTAEDSGTLHFIEEIVRECGNLGRTFKSALLFAVPADSTELLDRTKTALAWEDIQTDDSMLERMDPTDRQKVSGNVTKAVGDLRGAISRTYKNLMLLGRDNKLRLVDLGLLHGLSGIELVDFYVNRLRQEDEITESVGASKIVKYWPPSLEAWPTKAVRDAFFASPQLPRLIDGDKIRTTIANGVRDGLFAYATKDTQGRYTDIRFKDSLPESEVHWDDDCVLLSADTARRCIEPPKLTRIEVRPGSITTKPGETCHFTVAGFDQHGQAIAANGVAWSASGGTTDTAGAFVADAVGAYTITASAGPAQARAEVLVEKAAPATTGGDKGSGRSATRQRAIEWQGALPCQKWSSFYMRILTKFASMPGMELDVRFRIPANGKITPGMIAEIKSELRELGLPDDVKLDEG